MKLFFILLVFFLLDLFSFNTANSQDMDTLIYGGIDTVPFKTKFKNEFIEELSGIEHSGKENLYYVIPQSKKEAHIFLCSINITKESIQVNFDSLIQLNYGPLEAESIRVNPANNGVYIAEEGNGKSYIHQLDNNFNLKTIYASSKEQRHNKGYEGICFSPKGGIIYMGLESPKEGTVTNIISYNLNTKIEKTYDYALDILSLDYKKDNGITELLTLNDSALIVVERAFLGPKNGSSIRVYKAIIPTIGNKIKKVKLLTDFSASPKIDNIEGVSFSASGNELIFVSDDNGNVHQQTLFICMKIE